MPTCWPHCDRMCGGQTAGVTPLEPAGVSVSGGARQMRRSTVAILAAALVTLTACASGGGSTATPSGSAGASAAAVAPTKPVEFVISTAPGGGSDLYARAMASIISAKNLSPQPVQPLNKEGGSGAVAFTYVYDHKGDMHYVMITLNSFFTTIITQKLPYKATDFTPIANMALDPFFLWVNNDSTFKTAQDFVDAAKANSRRWRRPSPDTRAASSRR
ncbi:MAG: hypothetical protein E6I64_07990 [Chloroflexi bacterium]|nr:MAG: hypothetical protein E6I64_07990 [Chloroflexota bacterium]